MHLIGLTDLLRQDDSFRHVLTELQTNNSQDWHIIRSARAYVLATLASVWQAPIIMLTSTGRQAYNIAEQLPVWMLDAHRIYRFAEPTPMFYDRLPWDNAVIQDRIDTLQALLFADENKTQPLVITSARALMQRTMPVNQFRKYSTSLRVGDRYQLNQLIETWVALGYESTTMVVQAGTFSRRGGILDIFPMASRYPIRLEFFDDELDTLRRFDPSTQLTIESLK
ncbi:MAG: hypothetical protein AAFV93_15260, partial [Chloroflexota bacterium]